MHPDDYEMLMKIVRIFVGACIIIFALRTGAIIYRIVQNELL